ncbi:esterase [Marinomonas spartinae]|uniref:esterase n=1 Tax=Marinomonas spartinae TaxID=1792290 RepID=UPI0018F26C66|nr:esterase [Marinomonas spartinae]MBJ7556770.1 esterase [Marinomonas spartinae]
MGNTELNSLNLAEIGSFFSGGKIVTLAGQPARKVQVARNAEARLVDLNGDYVTGQIYVQYVRQVQPKCNSPIMFWHGGAMTGVTWETTPDGRPGWQMYFLRRGFDTYVCDAVERGRAGWSPYPEIYDTAPIFRTRNEAWELFRFGKSDHYSSDADPSQGYEGLKFPLNSLDLFCSQFVPRWTDHASITLEAYYSALEKIGPVWLVAHSQGGNFALEAVAKRPDLFLGVVVVEPASAPDKLGLANQVPHLFVWGDYIDRSVTWQGYRKQVDQYVAELKGTGGNVKVIDLPKLGIYGNSHVPMMDTNSDEVAHHIYHWIQSCMSC